MPVDDRLRIEVDRQGDNAVIGLHGELDLASAPAFSARFEEIGNGDPGAIIIDLSQLEFMDSTGLRSILTAREHCDQSGRRFAVVPGGRQVSRLLEIARVEKHLNLISSPAELAE
jgi:anti-sigma B factor antagonist